MAENFGEDVAFLDMGAGGYRPDRFYITIEARRYDNDAPLIELNDTGSFDRARNCVFADCNGLNAGRCILPGETLTELPSRLSSVSAKYPADPWDCGRT